jgi:chromosomal replication initiator protein
MLRESGAMPMEEASWDYSSLWDETLKHIRAELSEQEYVMWFKNLVYNDSDANHITLSVPSSFYKDQIIQRYQSDIEDKLLALQGSPLKLQFIIETKQRTKETKRVSDSPKKSQTEKEAPRPRHPQLKPEYSFETFVIGENNSFAANAAIAIARNPGTAYNPCLIYGGVGLGKTHLIQAIGDSIFSTTNNQKISYVTAETFTSEFISSIQSSSSHKFKKKYRSVDILLIDDIHFLQSKIQTQEELFYTFEALYNSNKQMVFTCDRPVSELKELTDRLRSRFERGLNVDLQPPDYETRIAILRKKTESNLVRISDDAIELIAKNVTTNVRDIEAALLKLVAYADLVNKNITLEIAQAQLRDFFANPNQRVVSIEAILRSVAEYFGLSPNDLRGKKRTKAIAFPRQIAMYLAREMTEYSTTEVGIEFGGRDHTTVMYACQKIENGMKTDSTLEPMIQILKRKIVEYRMSS